MCVRSLAGLLTVPVLSAYVAYFILYRHVQNENERMRKKYLRQKLGRWLIIALLFTVDSRND